MSDILFQALSATLDHFDAGFVAVSPAGGILHANRSAREMMNDGWPIQSDNELLRGWNPKTTSLLLDSLKRVAELSERSPSNDVCLDICLADATSPKGAAFATLKALASPGLTKPQAVLFVTGTASRGTCPLSGIAKCFGFTPAETRTLHHIMEGSTVAEAALALAVSENTVKTHLQNLFAKTRLSRQGELIKFINDLRPPLRHIADTIRNVA